MCVELLFIMRALWWFLLVLSSKMSEGLLLIFTCNIFSLHNLIKHIFHVKWIFFCSPVYAFQIKLILCYGNQPAENKIYIHNFIMKWPNWNTRHDVKSVFCCAVQINKSANPSHALKKYEHEGKENLIII